MVVHESTPLADDYPDTPLAAPPKDESREIIDVVKSDEVIRSSDAAEDDRRACDEIREHPDLLCAQGKELRPERKSSLNALADAMVGSFEKDEDEGEQMSTTGILTPMLQMKTDAELAAMTAKGLRIETVNGPSPVLLATRIQLDGKEDGDLEGDNEGRSRDARREYEKGDLKDYTTLPAIPPPPAVPLKDDSAVEVKEKELLPVRGPSPLPPKDTPATLAPIPPSTELQISLNPPLTPIPSRPTSPLSPNTSPGKTPGSDDEEEEEIHDLFEKSHRESMTEEQMMQQQQQPQSLPSPHISSPTISSPPIGSPAFRPPRTSSLSEKMVAIQDASNSSSAVPGNKAQTPTPEMPALQLLSPTRDNAISPSTAIQDTHVTPHRPPPPDDDLPFDFHRFLSQLRHRSADPVARFLRSFLHEFAKKQWLAHEQVKIVRDFLHFIHGKMMLCDVWRDVSDQELDNAQEGMEKLVMNRLYTQTFSPEIPPPDANVGLDGRPLRPDERFPGRKGQHQEDVERDEVLAQKVRIYAWVREEHLDIGETVKGEAGRRFLELAVKEIRKMGSYRAPRDKVICVLNCCKVIFGLLRHSKSDESADKFVPLLIYVVLRANPEHLVSNVQYILRFRNPDKLNGEAGYYLSSLMGAIAFIENLDRSSLTITAEEFERNVEAAVAAIAERPSPPPEKLPPKTQPATTNPNPTAVNPARPTSSSSSLSTSIRSSPINPNTASTAMDGASSEITDEKAAVAGLLRTIQKPLTTIGRIFSDDSGAASPNTSIPATPGGHDDALLTAVGGRRHQTLRRAGAESDQHSQHQLQQQHQHQQNQQHRPRLTAEDAAARQASAEVEEARRIGRMEYESVVEILKGMFPALDREVIGDVVRMKEGRVGLAVDACLALSDS